MGKFVFAVFRIGAIALFAFPMLSSQNIIQRSVKIPVDFRPGLSLDRSDNGYWIQYERAESPGDHPSIWMYDREGKLVISQTEI